MTQRKVYPAGTVAFGTKSQTFFLTQEDQLESWFDTTNCNNWRRLATLSEITAYYAAHPDLKRPVPEPGQDWETEKGGVVSIISGGKFLHCKKLPFGPAWNFDGTPLMKRGASARKYGCLVRRVLIEATEAEKATEACKGLDSGSNIHASGGVVSPAPASARDSRGDVRPVTPTPKRRKPLKPWARYKGDTITSIIGRFNPKSLGLKDLAEWIGLHLAREEWYKREAKRLEVGLHLCEMELNKQIELTLGWQKGFVEESDKLTAATAELERVKSERDDLAIKYHTALEDFQKAESDLVLHNKLYHPPRRTIWQVITGRGKA